MVAELFNNGVTTYLSGGRQLVEVELIMKKVLRNFVKTPHLYIMELKIAKT